MTLVIDRLTKADELVAIAEHTSLYQWLLSALQRPCKPQPLRTWLHADLGLQPSREREFISRTR